MKGFVVTILVSLVAIAIAFKTASMTIRLDPVKRIPSVDPNVN